MLCFRVRDEQQASNVWNTMTKASKSYEVVESTVECDWNKESQHEEVEWL